jgi:hypothetical protein
MKYLWRNDNQLQDLIFIGFCIGPVIAVIALNSVLYNGWRHVYFIYPTFVLITVVGLHWLWSVVKFSKILKTIIAVIVIGSFANTSIWMIQNHPLQNLYFNSLTKDWDKKYEVDYWGLAYKPLLEAILTKDTSQSVSIFPGNGYQWRGGWQLPFTQTLLSLDAANRSRVVSPALESDAHYSITSAQALKNIEAFKKDYRYSFFDEIKIDATVVLAAFKKIENPILPTPDLSRTILFGEYEKGSYYLIYSTWQEPENWGVWSKGKQSRLRIPTLANASSINFNLRALVNDKHPIQLIDVYINNRLIKSITLVKASDNLIEIPIEKNDLQSNFLDIEFKFRNPTSPSKLGINEDDRTLAIGLESMMVK